MQFGRHMQSVKLLFIRSNMLCVHMNFATALNQQTVLEAKHPEIWQEMEEIIMETKQLKFMHADEMSDTYRIDPRTNHREIENIINEKMHAAQMTFDRKWEKWTPYTVSSSIGYV